jgi:hypothetical protein
VPRVRAVPPRSSAPATRKCSTVGDRSTASWEPWAPTALGRACAPHYWRHPGRGSRPRPPSSRFHGFDPHEPNRPAPRIGVDSLNVLHRIDAVPRSGESSNRRKSEKTARHSHTLAAHWSAQRWSTQRRPHPVVKSCANAWRVADNRQPAEPTTQSRCVYVLAILPRPR